MKIKNCGLLLAAFLVVAATSSSAGPAQRSDVPAGAAWVLHLDMDNLRSTGVGQFLLSELSKPEVQAKFAVFQTIFNFDPRTAMHGITLFSTGSSPEDGVLVVYADVDSGRLETLARAAKGYASSSHNQHIIHNWIDEKRKPQNGIAPRTFAAIHTGKVIFAQRETRLAQALDVLDKVQPGLSASSEFPQFGAAGQNVFVQATARKLDLPEADPNAALMRLSRSVNLQVFEAQGMVNATFVLNAKDDEVAGHMLQVAQGLVALTKLQKDKPHSVKVAEATTVRQDGPNVVVELSLPVKDVVEVMKADAARKAALKGVAR